MSTTYIETYIFGFGGVTNKRNFTGTDNSAGVATTYGNINSAKIDRDNRRQDRVRKEIDGGETVDGNTKYYITQTALDADSSFGGTKLLTNEALHIVGRNLETNTTEVARQASRVVERGTYDANTGLFAGDVGTEKDRENARTLESSTTEIARQAARVAERGTYNSANGTYAGDVGTEKDREDARTLESGTTEVTRQAARVAESGTYNSISGTYDSTSACKEKDRQDYRDREAADQELTPWNPDDATNANYRSYINFPGNVA